MLLSPIAEPKHLGPGPPALLQELVRVRTAQARGSRRGVRSRAELSRPLGLRVLKPSAAPHRQETHGQKGKRARLGRCESVYIATTVPDTA
jgi:hypothetical protein